MRAFDGGIMVLHWGGPTDTVCWGRTPHVLRIRCAQTFRQRFLGLHAWCAWGDEPWGLLFPGCRAIHTLGLRLPVDLVFLGAGGRILHGVRGLAPNRLAGCGTARAVLELPSDYCGSSGWEARVWAAWRLWKMDA
ncbi:MAG: DUF192 domain-containing protein [Castellaniella sp.]|nr:DUF192 domain-containing protein [Castellaniella sp.]